MDQIVIDERGRGVGDDVFGGDPVSPRGLDAGDLPILNQNSLHARVVLDLSAQFFDPGVERGSVLMRSLPGNVSVGDEEFVKRAGFVLMARFAAFAKSLSDTALLDYFPIIEREATDPRNYVKKAVNWALRQIGKRNLFLNKKAIELAKQIDQLDAPSAHWIAKDALRELTQENLLTRLKKREKK